MNFINENELIELIKNKTFTKVKEIFNNNQFDLKKLNYFKDTLFYLISNNCPFDIIKYIIEKER